MRRAFTLIELLVVIAIIAILAAILFPVFAQAKLAAKKTKSLSNVKNLGTAFQIYLGDNDDVTPSIFGTNNQVLCTAANVALTKSVEGCSNEWWYPIFPYFKSIDLIYSDERTNPDTSFTRNTVFGTKYISAYGYNWGPFGWRGGGLLEKQVVYVRPTGGNGNINAGKSATSVTEPARVFVFGDTYDTPRATVGIGFSGDQHTGFSNTSLRYSGSFNYAFLDGHAKALPVKGGILPGAFNNRWIMPSNHVQWGGAYCSDPDAIIQPEDGTTSNLNSNPRPPALACGAYAQWVVDQATAVCAGNSTATVCRWGS
ncbi:MAG: prepilin-type N-terminal cleavage/methylation domain-containing protein [Fimbriimonas sp.]|nr:prepilin-type N-terminal cleavage/methylation domain-containing protein [Fimbriimonas sp.]